ncbi:hypothetical protein I317_07900 [Kwoniella heveanensis CBS 569]|nr:hypothetical protein I317_07900 [Kwoniella heveanensis CBS 569]
MSNFNLDIESSSKDSFADISRYTQALQDNILLNPLSELRETLSSIAFGVDSYRILLDQSFPTTEVDLDSVRRESQELGRTSERVVGRAEIICKDLQSGQRGRDGELHGDIEAGETASPGTKMRARMRVRVRLDAAGWTVESIGAQSSGPSPSSSSSSTATTETSPSGLETCSCWSAGLSTSTSTFTSVPHARIPSSDERPAPASTIPLDTITSTSAEPSLPSWMRSTTSTLDPSPPPLTSEPASSSNATINMNTSSKLGRTYESLEALMIDISPAYSSAMNEEIWKRFGMTPPGPRE